LGEIRVYPPKFAAPLAIVTPTFPEFVESFALLIRLNRFWGPVASSGQQQIRTMLQKSNIANCPVKGDV